MAKRLRTKSIDVLIAEVDVLLDRFGKRDPRLSLREKVLMLVELGDGVRSLGISVVNERFPEASEARERIRLYLLDNVGQVVDSRELAVVSGISEFARRVRELRVEQGYRILTGSSNDPDSGVLLKPDQYILVSEHSDHESARRWLIANRIRKENLGTKDRLLKYFMEMVNQVVTTEELSYIAKKSTEFARRVCELRTEEGYAIATRFTGRPELRLGEYTLLSKDRRAAAHDRRIPLELQQKVYERDKNTCRSCFWNQTLWTPDDPRILELHHVMHHQDGGANNLENLVVLCNRCHDDVHAGRRGSPTAANADLT